MKKQFFSDPKTEIYRLQDAHDTRTDLYKEIVAQAFTDRRVKIICIEHKDGTTPKTTFMEHNTSFDPQYESPLHYCFDQLAKIQSEMNIEINTEEDTVTAVITIVNDGTEIPVGKQEYEPTMCQVDNAYTLIITPV